MDILRNIVEFFSALLAPIVASVVIFQYQLACKKRKDDLFDRRWDYYCRAKKQFIDEFLGLAEKYDEKEANKSLRNWIDNFADEGLFLFGEDIKKHVLKLPDEIIEIVNYNENGKKVYRDFVESFREPFKKYLELK